MRIAGVTIPENKRLEIGLTVLFGMGRPRVQRILSEASIDTGTKPKDLTTADENKLRQLIEQFKVEGDLHRDVSANIKRLKDIKSYRGSRHSKHLPVHGQRTKTNSRTVRGNVRKTMGSGRRKMEKK